LKFSFAIKTIELTLRQTCRFIIQFCSFSRLFVK